MATTHVDSFKFFLKERGPFYSAFKISATTNSESPPKPGKQRRFNSKMQEQKEARPSASKDQGTGKGREKRKGKGKGEGNNHSNGTSAAGAIIHEKGSCQRQRQGYW